MGKKTVPATVLGSDTIGVLIITGHLDDDGQAVADCQWQPSPLEDAPQISNAELARVFTACAGRFLNGPL